MNITTLTNEAQQIQTQRQNFFIKCSLHFPIIITISSNNVMITHHHRRSRTTDSTKSLNGMILDNYFTLSSSSIFEFRVQVVQLSKNFFSLQKLFFWVILYFWYKATSLFLVWSYIFRTSSYICPAEWFLRHVAI